MKRRTVLRAGLGAAAVASYPAWRYYRGSKSRLASINAVTSLGTEVTVDASVLSELATSIRGTLLFRDIDGYDLARRIRNRTIDKYPALIAQCTSAADVIEVVSFGNHFQLLTAIKCGGHNIAGNGTCEGGLLIDLSPMRGATVNPELRVASVLGGSLLAELDEKSQKILETEASKDTKKNIEILTQISLRKLSGKKKRVHFLFLASPLEISGDGKVEKISMVRNQLVKQDDGSLRPQATENKIEEDAGLIFRSIGYLGKPLADLPFDQKSGTIPNESGQVKDPENGNSLRNREYVAGWIKRGPSGVIGTNKQDAVETVHRMLETFLAEKMEAGQNVVLPDIVSLLESRKVDHVSFADWKLLDAHETEAGEAQGRPRLKLTSITEMLEIIRQKR